MEDELAQIEARRAARDARRAERQSATPHAITDESAGGLDMNMRSRARAHSAGAQQQAAAQAAAARVAALDAEDVNAAYRSEEDIDVFEAEPAAVSASTGGAARVAALARGHEIRGGHSGMSLHDMQEVKEEDEEEYVSRDRSVSVSDHTPITRARVQSDLLLEKMVREDPDFKHSAAADRGAAEVAEMRALLAEVQEERETILTELMEAKLRLATLELDSDQRGLRARQLERLSGAQAENDAAKIEALEVNVMLLQDENRKLRGTVEKLERERRSRNRMEREEKKAAEQEARERVASNEWRAGGVIDVEFSEAHSGGGKLGTVFGKGGSGKGAMAGLGRFGKGALKGAKEAAKATASAAGVEILRGTELSEAEQQVVRAALKSNYFFWGLTEEHFAKVIEVLEPQDFERGEIIVRQGEQGDEFFICGSGTADCFVVDTDLVSAEHHQPEQKAAAGAPKLVRTIERGEAFCELSLLYSTKRTATVIAREPSRMFSLDKYSFQRIFADNVMQSRFADVVPTIPVLANLNSHEVAVLISVMSKVRHAEDATIVGSESEALASKGSDQRVDVAGDAMYIVETGEVVLRKKQADSDLDSASVEVGRKTRGDYFGEAALLRQEGEAQEEYEAVVASSTCTVLVLKRADFRSLMTNFDQSKAGSKYNWELFEKGNAALTEQIQSSVLRSSAKADYLKVLNFHLKGTIEIPLQFDRESTAASISNHQLRKDLQREKVAVNGEELQGKDYERVIGAVRAAIGGARSQLREFPMMQQGEGSAPWFGAAGGGGQGQPNAESLQDLQAMMQQADTEGGGGDGGDDALIRDILHACDRTNSAGDAYFMLCQLFSHPELVHVGPEPSLQIPLDIQISGANCVTTATYVFKISPLNPEPGEDEEAPWMHLFTDLIVDFNLGKRALIVRKS